MIFYRVQTRVRNDQGIAWFTTYAEAMAYMGGMLAPGYDQWEAWLDKVVVPAGKQGLLTALQGGQESRFHKLLDYEPLKKKREGVMKVEVSHT